MPCYQERRVYTNLDLADKALLIEVLKAHNLAYREINGKVQVVGNLPESTVNTIKRAYAQKAIQKAAKAKGWNLTSQGQKLQLRR